MRHPRYSFSTPQWVVGRCLGFRLTTQVPHAVVPCYIRWPYLYQHGWGLVRSYQRRRQFLKRGGLCLCQSIPMRVSCRLLATSAFTRPIDSTASAFTNKSMGCSHKAVCSTACAILAIHITALTRYQPTHLLGLLGIRIHIPANPCVVNIVVIIIFSWWRVNTNPAVISQKPQPL